MRDLSGHTQKEQADEHKGHQHHDKDRRHLGQPALAQRSNRGRQRKGDQHRNGKGNEHLARDRQHGRHRYDDRELPQGDVAVVVVGIVVLQNHGRHHPFGAKREADYRTP